MNNNISLLEDWPNSRSKREEAHYCQQSMRGLQI